jgi:hypothetical protein
LAQDADRQRSADRSGDAKVNPPMLCGTAPHLPDQPTTACRDSGEDRLSWFGMPPMIGNERRRTEEYANYVQQQPDDGARDDHRTQP